MSNLAEKICIGEKQMSEDVKIMMFMFNETNNDLEYDSNHLEYGKFEQPPKTISANRGDRAFIACGTKGTATGTEGWVKYKLSKTDYYVTTEFDIPYSKSNKIIIKTSDEVDAILEGSTEHGSPSVTLRVKMRHK